MRYAVLIYELAAHVPAIRLGGWQPTDGRAKACPATRAQSSCPRRARHNRGRPLGDLVDEYRLLVFPTVLGSVERLFNCSGPVNLQVTSAGARGPAVLLKYTVAPAH